MKQLFLYIFVITFSLLTMYSCGDEEESCTVSSWYEDSDGDGMGNSDVSIDACEQPVGFVSNDSDTDDTGGSSLVSGTTPVTAFEEFNTDAVTVSFNGNEITIESNGLINHTSPYWQTDNSLYIDPVIAVSAQMSPGAISERSYSLTVSTSPEIATTSSSTGLGAIGIAITGAPIFNDEEGPNISLSDQVASGFDYAGGHMGPQGYHYHLEAQGVDENTLISHDDEKLVGIISDGFLIYGRKCNATDDYPTDLDESGGHSHPTQHSDDAFYHYHIINELYVNKYYLLFGEDYKGTANRIL